GANDQDVKVFGHAGSPSICGQCISGKIRCQIWLTTRSGGDPLGADATDRGKSWRSGNGVLATIQASTQLGRSPYITLRSPTLVRGLGAAALMSLMALAPAHAVKYLAWEAVELPVASGASCGNGTPYRFFVNRTPFTSKTVIIYEGGGACWGQKACMGGDLLSASNPNGVGADYMSNIRN